LKENQGFGKKDGGRHMSDKIVELLKTFFHTRKSERYTPKGMLEKLKKKWKLVG